MQTRTNSPPGSFLTHLFIFHRYSSAYAIMERLWNGTEEGRLVRVHNLLRSWDNYLNLNELKDCCPERNPQEVVVMER